MWTGAKGRILIASLLLFGLVVVLLMAFDTRVTVRNYRITSDKVNERVRIALITDFHCCDYGADSCELLDVVEQENPDLVLMAGDIIDDDKALPWERGYAMAAALAQWYPTYYATGNHEFWSGEVDAICAEMERQGVTVLRGADVTVAGLTLCGIDDPDVGEEMWRSQLDELSGGLDGATFSILMTHRPERVGYYTGKGFDLVVAGHAHGGQWRLPPLINGLMAPNQGVFPKYAGGHYDLGGGTTMVVSRGLARETTRVPRIFNPPELVMVEVCP